MQNTRLSEIDALKRSLSSVLARIDQAGQGQHSFLVDLDGLLEARNIRLQQIGVIGHLIETAFLSGVRSSSVE